MRPSPFAPEPIEVLAPLGRPALVTWKKRRRKVREITDTWRIDDGWWRMPVSRLYYVVELEGGSRITLFQDLDGGGWYRQNWIT